MFDRRAFLGGLALPAVAAAVAFDPRAVAATLAAAASDPRPPDEFASDEDFWFEVARAFSVDRSIINLNNAGVSPAPALVQDALARHLAYSNQAPAYTMWRVLEPQREALRERVAAQWQVSPEEVAFVRNASEGLQTCQFGLDLAAGDEVLTSTQDYPRMLNTFEQRVRREGIVLKKVVLPTPCEDDAEVVARFEAAITPRTRLLLVSHMINLTGQILPVKAVVAMARRHGVPTIVDGAHALAHFDFTIDELDCDYYASSLHKWLFAPHGTGLLYVRRERIGDLWPLMAAAETQADDIRKFEEIGTHPAANTLAIGEALTFHQGLGPARKAARLRWLRDRWARALLEDERVRLHTSLEPGFACGIATVQVQGLDSSALARHLWDRHRILVTEIQHEEFEGLRIAPSVYTTPTEIDHFVDAMRAVLRDGLPA